MECYVLCGPTAGLTCDEPSYLVMERCQTASMIVCQFILNLIARDLSARNFFTTGKIIVIRPNFSEIAMWKITRERQTLVPKAIFAWTTSCNEWVYSQYHTVTTASFLSHEWLIPIRSSGFNVEANSAASSKNFCHVLNIPLKTRNLTIFRIICTFVGCLLIFYERAFARIAPCDHTRRYYPTARKISKSIVGPSNLRIYKLQSPIVLKS
jgi:hypothetical protein